LTALSFTEVIELIEGLGFSLHLSLSFAMKGAMDSMEGFGIKGS
jgi:hypothetical protein